MNNKITEKVRFAPKFAGVYIFYENKTPLYIGKASNLKNRLQSYLKVNDIKTQQLHERTTHLKIVKLSSPIEALIQEARLIKALKPELNIYWRDDKNHFYVAFTKETFPKVFITHQIKDQGNDYLGPLTDGQALHLILKMLRRHFPYCTCFQSHLRHCLNAQINNCFGFCCQLNYRDDRRDSLVAKKRYLKSIKNIKDILSGKKKGFLRKIVRPEDNWVAENILEHSKFLENPFAPTLKKIECYDISNFAGKEAVGAFTVLINKDGQWLPDRSQFRKFKIRYTKNTRNDPAMIAEVLKRRLNHPEWPYPNLIIIDGGITQYNAARAVVKNIPLISFAKPNKKICGQNILMPDDQPIVEKAIAQTHRYVINYHRQIRGKIQL